MIIGDPYKFAILSGVINEWNIDDTFCNGVLLFCVNGDIYPKEVATATLRCEIEYLKQKLRNLTTVSFLYRLLPAKEIRRIAESPSKNGGVATSHLVKGRAFKGREVRKECRAGGLCGLCLYESGEDPAGSIL